MAVICNRPDDEEAGQPTAAEIGEARRDLSEMAEDDENWCVRVNQANQERLAADVHATRITQETEQERDESPFQRMLDSGTWRRSGP